MRVFITRFLKSEDGAVTVDWVVLTAGIVGLGVAIIGGISSSAVNQSTGVGAHIDTMSVFTY
ncbi:MAG: hypothetical protein QNJ13_03960 [Paracoccaceae bacterium]|nr:hypothetical protein [Paracoccaceae bacterium]